MLKYNQYNDFLKGCDSSSRLWEMIEQHHSAQQSKTCRTRKLRDLCQHNSKLHEIQSDLSGIEKWRQLSAITNQTSTDPKCMNRCINHPYDNCLTKLNRR